MSEFLRLYAAAELGKDGYPPAWHRIGGEPGNKHMIREAADYRCVRCLHPYPPGSGEWSPCDKRCMHIGPYRVRRPGDDWITADELVRWDGDEARRAGSLVNTAEGQEVEARWRILTVHHLDMNKANCRWWNLAALCQRCHLQVQGKVQMNRVWPWEHSEWFRIYVAGYYAHVYLGEELTREQTEARVDDLLELERAA